MTTRKSVEQPKQSPPEAKTPEREFTHAAQSFRGSKYESRMDTMLLTVPIMNGWVLPPFQRGQFDTKNVKDFAANLKTNGAVVAGTIVLGMLPDDLSIYLVDGQQRRHGCEISELSQFYGDVIFKHYPNMSAMKEDYKKLNKRLVGSKPDDILKADEIDNAHLHQFRMDCPFIGYQFVRRGFANSPVVSMAAVLRCWFGSGLPTPGAYHADVLAVFDGIQRDALTNFMKIAHEAWGNDREYYPLWGNLNLTLCMFLYRKLSIDPEKRRPPLDRDQFYKCLCALSGTAKYLEWLPGHKIGETDRSPGYRRIKEIFQQRLTREQGGKLYKMPQPDWLRGG